MAKNTTVNTIQGTLDWCKAYIINRPSTNVGGAFQQPALTNANLIMSTILAPPFAWQWNRKFTSFSATAGQTDYTTEIDDFGWLEKATISLSGMIPPVIELEIDTSLSSDSTQERPFKISPIEDDNDGNITFRLLPAPDQAYTVTLTYQKQPVLATSLFGASAGSITSISAASGGLTAYSFTGGVTNPAALVGTYVFASGTTIPSGSLTSPNDGLYFCTAAGTNSMTLQNPNGVLQAGAAGVVQPATTWAPIPDKYNFLYNRGMLALLHGMYDNATYVMELQLFFRQLVGCSEGLSETAKAIFLEDRLNQIRTAASVQSGTTASSRKGL